jgi:hypothetical protein
LAIKTDSIYFALALLSKMRFSGESQGITDRAKNLVVGNLLAPTQIIDIAFRVDSEQMPSPKIVGCSPVNSC